MSRSGKITHGDFSPTLRHREVVLEPPPFSPESRVAERDVGGEESKFCVVLGAQWGDEGKGKLVDILAQEADVCARFNGGANAGHTLIVEGQRYAFHLLPCGMISMSCKNLIGNGVVCHIPTLMRELEELSDFDANALQRVFISTRCHVLIDSHQLIDGLLEAEKGSNSIGTTKRGIGPAYSSKAMRNGLRFGDLLRFDEFEKNLRELISWSQRRFGDPRSTDTEEQAMLRTCLREYNTKKAFDPVNGAKGGVDSIDAEVERYRGYAKKLRAQIVDSVTFMHEEIGRGHKILVEGANAALLDIDFGTYPFVTSSSTTIGGVCTGLGVPPKAIDVCIGVVKAYTTRVGAGPFPTQLQNELQDLEDTEILYVGADQTIERSNHASGAYVAKKGTKVRAGEFIQEVGREYGTTTGRRRRAGWLDIPLVKYSALVNGFDSLNLTKLDILTGLKEIRVCICYRSADMTEIRLPRGYFPSHLKDLEKIIPEYETMEGWTQDISKCTRWEQLPRQAQKYVERVASLLDVPVSWVGVGPGREAMFRVPPLH